MGDRKGGIPAWQRSDYTAPTNEHVTDSLKDDESSNKAVNNQDRASLPQDKEPSESIPVTEQAQEHEGQSPRSAASSTPSSYQQASAQATSFRDRESRPPIITYPEHLTQPQKPPPLVTTARLLNTAYVFAGAALTLYGMSEYLVKPMVDSLSLARHDFQSHSKAKVEELNRRLEAIVSTDPRQGVLKQRTQDAGKEDAATDTASEDSDPTELFHRDIGTQTTADDLAGASSSSSNATGAESVAIIAEAQKRQIERIRGATTELTLDNLASESQTIYEVRTVGSMLREQLEALAYPAANDGGAYGLGAKGAGFSNIYGNTAFAKKESNEVSAMKQEIRSLKGSLLSARNFPSSAVPAGRRDLFPAR
ncbi:MAG: hypothetical protein Q9162_003333 [Coniocarpon cinnabarinum]